MTSHELARKLLAGPDVVAMVYNADASAPEEVKAVSVDVPAQYMKSGPNRGTDADGVPLPVQFVMVAGWLEMCGAKMDSFVCNLQPGHDGDHRDEDPSGGCVGWSA